MIISTFLIAELQNAIENVDLVIAQRFLANMVELEEVFKFGFLVGVHSVEVTYNSRNLTLTHSDQESRDLSMSTRVIQHDTMEAPDTFHPYPNKSSFLLGDWFWNGGIQKSHKSFEELLRIIGDADFRSEDIRLALELD
ncbi:hypothetical protein DFH29DRAFT_1010947 [Suillus ampliporus]|nr:hypothetical protein DFH29DRAFT_1010947 [Suillus ampliporus]